MDSQDTPKPENTTPETTIKPVVKRKPAVRKPAATTNTVAKPTTSAAPRRRTPAAKPAETKVEVEKAAPIASIEVFKIDQIIEEKTIAIKKKK